jgi:hypothetical protein
MEWIDLGGEVLNMMLCCVHGSVLPIGNNFSVAFDEKFDSFMPSDGATFAIEVMGFAKIF